MISSNYSELQVEQTARLFNSLFADDISNFLKIKILLLFFSNRH